MFKLYRKHNFVAYILLIVFGFASLATCTHEPCEEDSALAADHDSKKSGMTFVVAALGDFDDHGDHGDSHLCPCLCHSPAFVSSEFTSSFSFNPENISDNHQNLTAKGFLNRIERPPRNS